MPLILAVNKFWETVGILGKLFSSFEKIKRYVSFLRQNAIKIPLERFYGQ